MEATRAEIGNTGTNAAGPVGVALVGCGAVSRLFYAPALLELERLGIASVTAVLDRSVEAKDALRSTFPKARPIERITQVSSDDTELAIIALPPKFHREETEAAFRNGQHVLCEKPLAPTSAEGEAMILSAQASGRILAAGHYKRFFPAHRVMKAMIEKGVFGALRSIEIAEGGRFGWPAASDSFFRREQTPGGVLLDIGIHVLDLLNWWLGFPTSYCYSDDNQGGVEANCLIECQFLKGTRGTIRLSRDWETPNCYVFRFERATIHSRVNASNQLELTLDGIPVTFAAELRDPVAPIPTGPTQVLETNPQAFIAQLVDVCDAIRTGRSPFVSGADCLPALRWVENCYASRHPIELADSNDEPIRKTLPTAALG